MKTIQYLTLQHSTSCDWPAEIFAVLDAAKEDDPSEGVTQHQEEHAHNDEEGLEHWHQHRQHECLQSSLQQQYNMKYTVHGYKNQKDQINFGAKFAKWRRNYDQLLPALIMHWWPMTWPRYTEWALLVHWALGVHEIHQDTKQIKRSGTYAKSRRYIKISRERG